MNISISAAEIGLLALSAVASGVVSGLLAGVFGIGGGAVLVPVFYQALGLYGIDESVRMHLSVGSSLAIIIPTSIRSFTAHKARGAVDMQLLRSYLVPVPVGVVLASLAAAYLSSESLRLVFACIAVVVGLQAAVQPRQLAARHRNPRQSVARRSSARRSASSRH